MNGEGGKRLLITRSAGGCAEWDPLIRSRGHQAIHLPCLEFEFMRDDDTRARLTEALADATWLVLTSARAVRAFLELHPQAPRQDLRIAAVGEKTAGVVQELLGRTPELTTHSTGQELAETLVAQLEGEREHLVAAGSGRSEPHLERALAGKDERLTRLATYQTWPAAPRENKRDLGLEQLDALLLASPSTAEGLLNIALVPDDLPILSIGPTTTRAATRLGLHVTREARQPSLEGLLEVL